MDVSHVWDVALQLKDEPSALFSSAGHHTVVLIHWESIRLENLTHTTSKFRYSLNLPESINFKVYRIWINLWCNQFLVTMYWKRRRPTVSGTSSWMELWNRLISCIGIWRLYTPLQLVGQWRFTRKRVQLAPAARREDSLEVWVGMIEATMDLATAETRCSVRS